MSSYWYHQPVWRSLVLADGCMSPCSTDSIFTAVAASGVLASEDSYQILPGFLPIHCLRNLSYFDQSLWGFMHSRVD